ncbi:hypothetical protein SPHINGO391_350002 [Sphingomonas aurantiaca]|uniref:Uncharacterized protein n=1 Tax=Sphingomonas aurantiaca TaxID=185949 RepID=A0A5E7Y2L8_9SPHN|nr:hypothetical protein SPHINGO391_350002 [Sphingomonas aurantiaca]
MHVALSIAKNPARRALVQPSLRTAAHCTIRFSPATSRTIPALPPTGPARPQKGRRHPRLPPRPPRPDSQFFSVPVMYQTSVTMSSILTDLVLDRRGNPTPASDLPQHVRYT